MPLSWVPQVAANNPFANPGTATFPGTYLGYLTGNVWFYSLGALLVLTAAVTPDVSAIGHQISGLAGGAFVLLVLLVGESDQAFANIYSSAVTVQNVFPRASQRALIVGVAAIGVALAATFTMVAYEFFLFLIGSVFVPLAGVFLAHYFVLNRGGYGEARLFGPTAEGVRWRAMIPWVLGFLLYHWCVPTGPGWWQDATHWFFSSLLRLPFPLFDSALGASIPSFIVAFALALAILPWGRRPDEAVSA
jgi:purine-cytosine permease-like protein